MARHRPITVRLKPEERALFDALAKHLGRTSGQLAVLVLRRCLADNRHLLTSPLSGPSPSPASEDEG